MLMEDMPSISGPIVTTGIAWCSRFKLSKYVSWLCGPEGAKVTAGCGNRPAWVSEEVAEVLASVDGFPQDENSKKALLPSMVSIEIGVSDKLAEIQTILNEEHTMIMTREISVDEGIEEMNERVAELYE